MIPPDAPIPVTAFTFLFGSAERRAPDILTFVDSLPRLCRGALLQCELGTSSLGDHCVCVAAFRGALPEATTRRLEFWAWRLGGTASQGNEHGVAALRACDKVLRQVPPWELFTAVRDLLSPCLGLSPDLVQGRLTLRLGLDGPDAAGLTYERHGRVLFVPSPRLPPVGEPMAIVLQLPGGGTLEAEGLVTGLRRAGDRDGAQGAPAGFFLGLVSPTEPVLRTLADRVPPQPLPGTRRAPRYPVRVLASLAGSVDETPGDVVLLDSGERDEDALTWVENLSQRGAFVSTGSSVPKGTKVRLEMELPGGDTAEVPGAIVFEDERGVGICFEPEQGGEAAIASALEQVTVHRRRALIVDDDFLSRRMMGDALAARGFEVFAAADGADGLRTLIDLLLGLDLVMVDLHMPHLDGEKLIKLVREQGGERELTVVVMTGEAEPAALKCLMAAGANAVLPKSDGMEEIAEAAVKTMLRRERSRRPRPRLQSGLA